MTDTHLSDPVRTLDGHLVPAPGVWRIDPGHADLAFTGRHLLVTKVRGRFTRIDGAVRVAPQMTDSSVHVSVDMASVESGNSARDTHTRSAELFDVERYPTATFVSTHVSWHGNRGTVTGDLTIHGSPVRCRSRSPSRATSQTPGAPNGPSSPPEPLSTARTSTSPGTWLCSQAGCWCPGRSRSRSTSRPSSATTDPSARDETARAGHPRGEHTA